MNPTVVLPSRRLEAKGAAILKDQGQQLPVAVLEGPLCCGSSARQQFHDVGLEACFYRTAAPLVADLSAGKKFSVLVLAFEGSVTAARVQLVLLKELARNTPILLLMGLQQVELASEVMLRGNSDYLLAPYSDDEMTVRVLSLQVPDFKPNEIF